MCGRLSQYRGIHDFVDALSMPNALVNTVGDEPLNRYNLPPTSMAAVLRCEGVHLLAADVRWGWKPNWDKGTARRINARVEKVAHGPYFRQIWPHRALAAIDGWFEWVADPDDPKHKQPYLIRLKNGEPIFCASIGQFSPPHAEPAADDGFVILTADAEGGMVDIHDRRPVVLAPDLAEEWLSHDTPKERAEEIALLQGCPVQCFEWFKVDKAVGNVRNGGPWRPLE
ncbi:SOS response-associated peptidase [Pseudomonas sp. R5(2019)]|uniref:SOS response-associated peptidase n=1 Tax=Pseudomonas sp. R5(2019) TaxID=2697566 RepID=UPI0014129C6C|nr:SOS response-associated peptidase family protein [Pseudomonas sp. R5(2019)]NBA98177.1 DUF159 family protein [Pseudomonas sp. R5(2019)]